MLTTIQQIREFDTGVYVTAINDARRDESGRWTIRCTCGNEYAADAFDTDYVGKPCQKCEPVSETRKLRYIVSTVHDVDTPLTIERQSVPDKDVDS